MASTRIYSTLFVEVVSMSPNAGYLVPAGTVAIVRDVSWFFFGTPGNTAFSVYSLATGAIAVHAEMTSGDQFGHLELRQVFPAGSEIQAQGAGPNEISIRVSGYLLSAP